MAKWLDKYNDGGPVQENYNDASASMGPDFVGLGYDTTGRNYSPAWGGQFAMGGNIPGSVGFTYARTNSPAPSNGKYAKKTLASAQNGQEMKFYQEGLDFKPKTISKNGSVIKDDRGQWAHPGEVTEIGSNEITMHGVDYPVLGISDTGDTKMMYPDQDYKFDGEKVTEYPMAQDGENISGNLKKQAEEFLARRNNPNNRPNISQYTPKKGEMAKLKQRDLQRIKDEEKLLNKFAKSKAAGNLQDAAMFATDVMTLGEAAVLTKPALKVAAKYATEKTALLPGSGNIVGEIVNKSITPIGYDPFTVAAAPLELLTPKALKFKPKTFATKNRFDAWRLYNGLEPEFSTFSKNADGTLAINDFRLGKDNLQKIVNNPKESFGTMEVEPEFNFAGVHGNGWVTKGVDEQGRKFIDFTDTWDLQPLKGVKGLPKKVKEFEVSSLTGGKPFDLKNRIYYDDAGNFFDHSGNKLVEEMQHFPKGVVDQNKAVNLPMLSTKNVVGTKQMDVLNDWNKATNQKFLKGTGTLVGGVGAGIGYLTHKEKQKQKQKLKKQNGGWLNKFQEGGTLMTNKKVGEKVTPINKLDLRPTIYNYKRTEKDVYDPNCPDGVGCSKQATDIAQSITGLPRVAYAPADAAYRDAVAERTGLINIFDQEGEQKKYANSKDASWKYPTEQDFTNWRAGDIVTLDAGVDRFLPYRAPKGFKYSDNTNTSHNGVITGFTETGRPIISHGYATSKNKGKQITEVLGKDNRVTNLGHGRYAVKSVWRPKEIDASGDIKSIQPVIDTAEERAGRKKATTSNSSFYLKPTEEERLQKDLPVGAEFSGANTRLQTKNKLINLFNDEKLDDDLQYKLGITAQELDKLKPVVYGVFGQESNFNDVDNAGASFKELIGNLFGGNSRGAAQIKMSSLTAEEKKVLGIKKASDLDKDEVAYKAALLMLNNSRKRMNREIEQGTHPELADKDEYFRAGYYYNSPARAIQSSEKWTKKKNNKATKADISRNELRMDEGSYPYKLMERAKDLGVNVDFDVTSDLEPVVVRSVVKNKKGTKFVPKQETGGWLNKYK